MSRPATQTHTHANIHSYISWFDVLGIEPTIPQVISLDEQKKRYEWSTENDYPPHLRSIPKEDQQSLIQIFNIIGLVGSATILPKIVPKKKFLGSFSKWLYEKVNEAVHGEAYEGLTIADVEEANKHNRKTGTDIMKGDNVGLLSDWWSDARFAAQSLTGTNPSSIRLATEWIDTFKTAASKQDCKDVNDLIGRDTASLYVQDASYLRTAVKSPADATLKSSDPDTDTRYACASVTLFHLSADGKLHPLAIIIDWKGSLDNSIVIFNKRLQPYGSYYATPSTAEKNDWPWRFAKTCAQTADWIRHEVAVHLTETHLIEEAVIVSANRTLPSSHPVYRLLEPHWFRTLSLNAAARKTLVPSVVIELMGTTPEQAKALINYTYDNFNFTGKYIPQDLKSRGFPPDQLDKEKYKNYPYARNMVEVWAAIRNFVKAMIVLDYAEEGEEKGDRRLVSSDKQIAAWYSEIQSPSGGRLRSFPTIKTRDDLIDAVTMSIHIASPQHTAVNYLQNFYQSFVIAKPPAIYIPPPSTLTDLNAIKEADLVKALPISRQRDWLLASQIPWLLSFRVASEYNLVTYAASIWNLYRKKTGRNEQKVKEIAAKFYAELRRLIDVFEGHSEQQDKGAVPYVVLDPNTTAVSILI